MTRNIETVKFRMARVGALGIVLADIEPRLFLVS